MNTMSFYEFRSEQTGSGSRSYIFKEKTKPYHSQTCFKNILRTSLNEKLNFYHHIIERNAQMHLRSENSAELMPGPQNVRYF